MGAVDCFDDPGKDLVIGQMMRMMIIDWLIDSSTYYIKSDDDDNDDMLCKPPNVSIWGASSSNLLANKEWAENSIKHVPLVFEGHDSQINLLSFLLFASAQPWGCCSSISVSVMSSYLYA